MPPLGQKRSNFECLDKGSFVRSSIQDTKAYCFKGCGLTLHEHARFCGHKAVLTIVGDLPGMWPLESEMASGTEARHLLEVIPLK